MTKKIYIGGKTYRRVPLSPTEKEPAKEPAPPEEKKRCTKCGFTLKLTDFHKDKREKDGLRTVCRFCINSARRHKNYVNKFR